MNVNRSAGVLLHITSLPGYGGIGSLGKYSYKFVDFLHSSGQKYWQILPLNPIGSGNCPYCSYSSFAGNYLLIDMELLYEEKLIDEYDLKSYKEDSPYIVDYKNAGSYKNRLLLKAYNNFIKKELLLSKSYVNFCNDSSYWLDEYSEYMVLKENKGKINSKIFNDKLYTMNYYKFVQYIFFKQWFGLKKYANDKGIKIIGDIPFYVPYGSADVHFNPDLFYLDKNKRPSLVSGVPPDYFCKEGQLWNTPVYNWEKHKEQNYMWWFNRITHALKLTDIVRLDHFRAFSEFWAVPAEEKTAVNGKWMKGPGKDFFKKLIYKYNKTLPIIAEDLGIIDSNVEDLRNVFNFPGMRVLQFAFNDLNDNLHLPHNHNKNLVVYTGTHDNNTTLGWYFETDNLQKERLRKYLRIDGSNICWDLIACAYSSTANIAIIPLQDILCFGSDTRMNIPGTPEGNWQWRFIPDVLTEEVKERLNNLCKIYYR